MSSHKKNAKRTVAAVILLGGGVAAGVLAVVFTVGLARGVFRDGPAPDADATRTNHEQPVTPRRQERNQARIQTAASPAAPQSRGDNVFGRGPGAIAGVAGPAMPAETSSETGELAVGGPHVSADYAAPDRAVSTSVGASREASSNASGSLQNEGGGGPAAGFAGSSVTSRASGGGGESPKPGTATDTSPVQASKPAKLPNGAPPRIVSGAAAPIVVAGSANPMVIAGMPNSPPVNTAPAAPKQPQVQPVPGGSAALPASPGLPFVGPRAPLSVGTPQQSGDTAHAPLPVLIPVRPGNAPAGPIPTPDDLINIQDGTVTGTGSIPGNVIIGENAVMNPGNSPGTIQVGGNIQYGNLLIEIAGPTSHDLVEVAGTATFVEKSTITFKFLYGYLPSDGLEIEFLRAGTLLGLQYISYALAGGTLPTGFHYQVWEDGESDLHVRFYGEDGNSQPSGYVHGEILYDGRIPGIPEPSTPALALLGLTLLGWQWRRSHKRPVPSQVR